MKIALVVDRLMLGGVAVSTSILYKQLSALNNDTSLIVSSSVLGNGGDVLVNQNIPFLAPCIGVDNLRSRCAEFSK